MSTTIFVDGESWLTLTQLSAGALLRTLKDLPVPSGAFVEVEIISPRVGGGTYKRKVGKDWPFDIDIAEEMVSYAREDKFPPETEFTLEARNLGRFGKLGWAKEVGPPAWPVPRPILSVVLRGKRAFTVGIGWRMTAYYFHWVDRQP